MRLVGANFSATGEQENNFLPLFKLQQAMDKLWLAVQL
jgi:hypothetical protein